MAAELIDGKAIAQEVRAQVARDVAAWVAAGPGAPGLATVLVGDDPASRRLRRRQAEGVARGRASQGFDHRLPADAPTTRSTRSCSELNADPRVSGILLQLPTPPQVDGAALTALIDPDKDVDGLTPISAGPARPGPPGLRPCTPAGVMELLRRHDVDARGRRGGRRRPLRPRRQAGRRAAAAANATVTICHSRTRDLAAVCRRADVLVAAVGRPRLVQGDWVKPGATVIDVGINRTDDGLVGDVDFEAAAERAGPDHAGARRRRPDDDRDAAAQHAARGPGGRAGAGRGGVELTRLRAGE